MNSVYHLLHRLGLVWITVRSKHPQQNQAVQDAFKKNFADQVLSVLPKAVSFDQVDIWFQDEAALDNAGHSRVFGQRKGHDRRVVRQQQFTAAYVFGAVCPGNDSADALLMPNANTEAMQYHLDGIAQMVETGGMRSL